MTFSNDSDFISFRHHVYHKTGKDINLLEVGPRFEMQRKLDLPVLTFFHIAYQIKLGTMDIKESDVEWVSKPYMRTAKKRLFL